MATSSFYKAFVVQDAQSIKTFINDYNTPKKITVSNRNYDVSSKKGIELLKRKLSD